MKNLVVLLFIAFSGFNANCSLYSISPTYGNIGQTLDVTIVQPGANFTNSNYSVYFFFYTDPLNSPKDSAVKANYTTSISYEKIIANISIPENVTSGYYSLMISNEEFTNVYVRQKQFYVVGASTIKEIYPKTGKAGKAIDVEISGFSTHFTSDSNIVEFMFEGRGNNPTRANKVTALNDTLLLVNISIPLEVRFGDYDVNVYNSTDNLLVKQNYFHVDQANVLEYSTLLHKIGIAPNPFYSDFFVELIADEYEVCSIILVDLQGKIVYSEIVILNAGKNKIRIYADLPKGIYIVKLNSGKGHHTGKIIKK